MFGGDDFQHQSPHQSDVHSRSRARFACQREKTTLEVLHVVFGSKESMMASCSNLSSERPTAKSSDSRKRLPEEITELLDVAIFTFSCQSGLRSVHKIRGDPVLEGVSAFFGHLIRTANVELQAKLEELSPSRLGGWQPGQEATSQLLTLVSSRIKTLKQKQVIREDRNPTVPSLLVEKHDRYVEEEDRVKTSMFARCWRCKSLCQYCSKMMRRGPNFGNFRTE